MIDGVIIKDLVTHQDNRGFFRELIRNTDGFFSPGFGQLSHSLVREGVVKAWHGHIRQYQWTYVIAGILDVVVYDARVNSRTYRKKICMTLGDEQRTAVYVIPPGVVHGYRCVSGPAHVLYVTSGVYEPEEELRIPLDDQSILHNWNHPNDQS